MYTPPAFDVDDWNEVLSFLHAHPFATLISALSTSPAKQDGSLETENPAAESANRPFDREFPQTVISHLPLIHQSSEATERGLLVGHFARANEHWRVADGQPTVALFHGPHAYVSAIWYDEPNVVPTWNYQVVHVHGMLRTVKRPRLMEILRTSAATFEPSGGPADAEAWSLEKENSEFIEKLAAGIVGFEIEIQRIEAKYKLSQNHSAERRRRVESGLEATGAPGAFAVAAEMRRVNAPSK